MRRMQGLDTTFFQAETPSMHLHVVGVMVLDPSSTGADVGYETIVGLMRQRIHLLPPLRWQPVTVPGGLDQPRWIEAPDFDVEHHIHRAELEPPAGMAELARLAGRVASVPLDRSRPLWEMHVVEGMADGSVALVTKLHHSFMDGGAGSDVMASLFDLTPEGTTVIEPDEEWVPDAPPHPVRLVVEAIPGTVNRVLQVPGLVLGTAQGVLRSARSMQARRGPAGPRFGPSTPLDGPLSSERQVAFARVALSDVRRTKAAFGVTVNDVALAAATSAMRAALAEVGAVPDRALIAMVPVSERGDAEREFTNRTTAVAVGLPVHLADPVDRLRAVHDLASDAKDRHAALGNGVLEGWASLLPPYLVRGATHVYTESGVSRFVPPVFNLIVSNIPGPPIPLYLAGAEVTHIFPMGPLFEGTGVNITLLSQGDVLDIGIMACPSLIDDPQRLAAGLVDGFDELAALAAGIEATAPEASAATG